MDIIKKVNIERLHDSVLSWLFQKPTREGRGGTLSGYEASDGTVERERHPIPTIDEVLQDMSRSKVFSKLDLSLGYHQIELSEESRGITTLITHQGLCRYKRLMFGISSAPKKYHQVI